MKREQVTKHTASILFAVYVLLLPVWLYFASWQQLLIGYACYWFMADMIQSKFHHHWASHKLWNPPRWLQIVFSTLGAGALIGTPISWAAWHRTHHTYSDTDKDPHAPALKGTWYVIFAQYHTAQLKRAIDRLRDPYFRWLSRNEIYVILLINIGLFLLLEWTWFMTLWAIPVGYTILNTNYIVNVITHKTGKAKDLSPLFWPLVFADGITHGSHHDKPKLSHYKYDPSSWLINKLGWA
jgi:fatty-acid desaturase